MIRPKYICPICRNKSAVRIVYGYPSEELMEEARRKEVKLGGCCILEGIEIQPKRHCTLCGFEWPRKQRQKMSFLKWLMYKNRACYN